MMRPLILVLVFALAGCGTEPVRQVQEFFQPTPAKAALNTGLKQYEEGDYDESLKNLQSAIKQGLTDRDTVNAHVSNLTTPGGWQIASRDY